MLVFSHSIVAILRSEEVFIIASVFTPPSGMVQHHSFLAPRPSSLVESGTLNFDAQLSNPTPNHPTWGCPVTRFSLPPNPIVFSLATDRTGH